MSSDEGLAEQIRGATLILSDLLADAKQSGLAVCITPDRGVGLYAGFALQEDCGPLHIRITKTLVKRL